MKLCVKSFALAGAILWALAVFVTGLAQQANPDYGLAFLEMSASIYPGYEIGGFGSVIVGTLYAVVDGAVCGALFAWLYNRCASAGASTA
ncbi:MAG: hypothetical protein ACE5HF_08470 [Gemmatimonadota bacterium]